LSSEQLTERINLHAERAIYGKLTYHQIAMHWYEKYGINIHSQSEKEWAYRESNKKAIQARVDEIIRSEGAQIASISDQALVNTLAKGAKDNAFVVSECKLNIRSMLKGFDKLEEKEQKSKVKILKDLSKVAKDSSDSLTEMIKVAGTINKSAGIMNKEIERQAKLLAKNNKAEDDKTENILDLSMSIDDIESAREAFDKEDGETH
jgi:hypothetical protein